MKFILEYHLKPGAKRALIDAFDLRGPNRIPGVSFRGAWIGTRSEVVYVLGESADEASIAEACQPWREHGDFEIHPVIDIEDF
jgi:hypothetical protein